MSAPGRAAHLSADASDEEILRIVEAWIDDLARGDFAAAYARTQHDPYYRWTPELMAAVVAGYGSPEPHPCGERFTVTDRLSATGQPHAREVTRECVPPGAVAWVRHDLPLNGAWSDLTATFRVEPGIAGLVVILEEIHVF